MATTTRAANSPVRRSLVWSHNTSYTGAAGVHSEVSRKAHALHVTGQRELSTNLSTIQSMHRKEMQNLRHSRKSVETSMLAYTEKMRRISTDRLQLTDGTPAQNNATLERLLALSKASTKGGKAKPRPRISVDSGIDVDEPEPVSDVGESSPTNRASTMRKSASQPLLHQRPSSFSKVESLEDLSSGHANKDGRRKQTTDRTSDASRQRRPGITDKPDILALKLSMENPKTKHSQRQEEEDDADRSPSVVSSDVSVAITPFPEFRLHVSEVAGEGLSTSSVVDEDEERLQGTTSRTSQSSRKKSKKTRKDDYWSYRKSPRRHSTTPRSGTTTGKPQENTPQASSPSPLASPKRNRGLIRGPKPPPPPKPKPFNHSFRYSEAVEGVIKSIDDSKDVDERTLRRASEILPALDIRNLREERKRQLEEAKKSTTETRHEERDSPSVEDSGVSSEEELVVAVARERSFSAPNILEHDPHDSSECGGSDGEAEGELKPVLRKYDSAELNVPSRKTVQFLLPELTREVHIES
nr:hypothetical protein BaRGS_010903 [Batillaria attramentaria]